MSTAVAAEQGCRLRGGRGGAHIALTLNGVSTNLTRPSAQSATVSDDGSDDSRLAASLPDCDDSYRRFSIKNKPHKVKQKATKTASTH